MNKKIRNIIIIVMAAIISVGAIGIGVFAADTTAPRLTFYQNAGEILKSSQVGIYVDDENGVTEIRYYWDYDLGGATEQVLNYASSPLHTKRVNIQAPSTPGVHMLMACAIDAAGNRTPWARMPYYVVDSLSGVADTTPSTFVLSNEK